MTTALLSAIVVVSLIPMVYGTLSALVRGELQDLLFYLIFLLLPANLGLVGAVLTTRRPENRVGWLLLVAGALAGLAFACGEYERFVLAAGRLDAPLLVPAAWIASSVFIPAIGILVVFLPLLYPSGHLDSPRWRVVVGIGVLGVTSSGIGLALAPGPLGGPGGPLNPLSPPEPLASLAQSAATIGNLAAPPVFLLAFASLLRRFRRSSGVERQQIKWFLFAAAVATFAFVISIPNVPVVSDIAWAVGIFAMGFLPLAIGIAILRYRLYEIDRIVNRTIVYGAVTAILAGVFAAATALSQRLFISVAGQSSDLSIVMTTLVVVAIYAPVRKRVEAVVDRYFKYDQRDYGPYLDELRRLLELVEPRHAAARLAREAMRNTGAIGVAVTDSSGTILAIAGTWPTDPAVPVPIEPDGSAFAAVLLGPRRDGRPHAEARLLALRAAASIAVAAINPASPRVPPASLAAEDASGRQAPAGTIDGAEADALADVDPAPSQA